MTPGLELDAVVAGALGWKKLRRVDSPYYSGAKLFGESAGSFHEELVPRYSTDIAAAWELVEDLRARRLWVGVASEPDYWECWWFDTQPVEGWPQPPKGKLTAPTAPHAICLAFLKATEAA